MLGVGVLGVLPGQAVVPSGSIDRGGDAMSTSGKFEVSGSGGGDVRITLDGDRADVVAGGAGRGGDLLLRDDQGRVIIRLNAGGEEGAVIAPQGAPSTPPVVEGSGNAPMGLASSTAVVEIRATGGDRARSGELDLRDPGGDTTLVLRAAQGADASIAVGGAERAGWIVVRDGDGHDAAFLSGHEGSGTLELRDAKGVPGIVLRAVQGEDATVVLGGAKRAGWIVVRDPDGEDAAYLTGHDGAGRLELRDKAGITTITLRGNGASGWFGGHGTAGDVLVLPAGASALSTNQATVWIRGDTGDVVLRNADCAEELPLAKDCDAPPGSVVALDEGGTVRLADRPYDTRVAGVVSGAGGLRPGIVLGRTPGSLRRLPVALSGRVFCRVDATYGSIAVGDLLTTSATAGHAMAARDPARAFGSVLGKAMNPLAAGRGAIPVLVALQ
jgi:hypothetical protein